MGAIGLLWYPLSFAFILLIGLLKLEQPLGRDQALHFWVGTRVLNGAILYKDVWDVRQPAILMFHAAAIALFGPSVRSVHLLELIWMGTLGVLIMILLRRYYRYPWLSAAAAVAAIAPYYVLVEPYGQTQVEIMIGLPFFLTAWLLWRASEQDKGSVAMAFGAGVAAGVGTAFKHVLAPIPVTFALLAAWFAVRRPRQSSALACVGKLWIPFAAGVIAVWGAIFLVFVGLGAFPEFFWTNFLWPLENLNIGDKPPVSQLIEGALILLATTAAWALLAVATVTGLFRSDEPKFTSFLWAWIVAGAFAIIIQRTSWWAYHFLMFYVPIGLLGIRGIDRIVGGLAARGLTSRPLAMALTALLFVLPLTGFARPLGEEARALYRAFVVDKEDADAYRRANFPIYAGAATVADYLKAAGGDDPVYIMDDLTLALLSGRDIGQAVPGQWFASLQTPKRWQDIPQKIEANPPRFFFVENRLADRFAQHNPSLAAMLQRDYQVVVDIPLGRLYQRVQSQPKVEDSMPDTPSDGPAVAPPASAAPNP
jgi:hypothetical protein